MTLTNTPHRKVRAIPTEEGEFRIEVSINHGQIFDDSRRKWSHDVFSLTRAELATLTQLLGDK